MLTQKQLCEVCDYSKREGKSPRCITCKHLIEQAGNPGSSKRCAIRPPQAIDAIRESILHGQPLYPIPPIVYACYYTEIPLNIDKQYSTYGDYASFDHVIPNNTSRVVLCSRIINDFKGWMTDSEFLRFVCEILDITAPRKLHGLSVEDTASFLRALQIVMRCEKSQVRAAREILERLSSKVRFGRTEDQTPDETVDARPTPIKKLHNIQMLRG
jgi:hypothetical protein